MTIPTLDAIRLEILMHRNAHFSENFDIMLEYYRKDGVGVMPDFSLEMIEELAALDKEYDLNEVLPEAARVEVEKAQERYHLLREVYSQNEQIPKLLSDLILSEEEEPTEEIEAIVAMGENVVPELIDLIRADTFYNPLYPGYGRSPIFAATCLSQIGDKRAIRPLFEAIGHENFFTDEAFISALRSFGEPAKEFLLDTLTHLPLSKENEHAAIALGAFEPDEQIATAALHLLEQEGALKRMSLAPYLIFACSALPKHEHAHFQNLINRSKLSEGLSLDASIVLQNFTK